MSEMKKVWYFFMDCSKDRWVWYRVLKYLGSFLFALYFAAFRVEISESTRNFIVLPFSPEKSISDYDVDVHTVVYLLLTLVFLILLVFFMGALTLEAIKSLN